MPVAEPRKLGEPLPLGYMMVVPVYVVTKL